MFGRAKKKDELKFDPVREEPCIKKSICTGETVLGFREKETNRFRDIRKATSEDDVALFCVETGIQRDKIKTIY